MLVTWIIQIDEKANGKWCEDRVTCDGLQVTSNGDLIIASQNGPTLEILGAYGKGTWRRFRRSEVIPTQQGGNA